MFSFYAFENWWGLLQEENKYTRKSYKAPRVHGVPGFPSLILTL
ncbi:hypothetical protein IC006_2449 [Sulfuracidifex tepidarius]|uniref:Transposase ISC1058 n=1 Tax=Sulfuracidifex tepidarius TaxID=1294262 RepID=A0A510DY18_9CREN|nr:hypothetical protein IC006_2449 [Sulfuracidifex tepidarius]